MLYRFLLQLAATLRETPDIDRAPYAETLRNDFNLYGLADRVERDPDVSGLADYLEAVAAQSRGLTPEEIDAINRGN